ncbi:MAG: MerR family transcriptional regulator [Alphaproteobacteria bacterium]|jgi:DNA-binding transcriptional MerR regulator|nr:MerR family transcriptional regulator [Rhodospirillaceae bacterium]MDG2482742.1 MerR family transcriptional regulator [Alphaproteobacteria bacterium]MBT6203100.1 MerR family transcriptional regulator [Rhodospirillaceae bacterium]MBT6510482.1 MerR family transcriptional regulator [Rhodospirillaceae bacterium]MBT7613969.1 MerR family transcriptional regulator [Rhodospirillaceae bacterium]
MAGSQSDRANGSGSRRGGKSKAAFRTISEVADELDVAQHVLRFWETKFHQISPLKRGGGRRYYRPEDIEFLRQIKRLLYTEGYTIKGVQRLIRQGGVAALQIDGPVETQPVEAGPASDQQGNTLDSSDRMALERAVDELESCRRLLAARG